MAKELKKGIFITFEGPEGSGKSVHSHRISGELISDGYEIVHTSEPGDTSLGGIIRNILLDKDNVRINEYAELFLFVADRAQHVDEVIRPALEDKKIVICDRFSAATFAYQGYGLGMNKRQIKTVNDIATKGLEPDLTLILDVDVRIGLARAGARGRTDKMEKRAIEFHEKVRRGYLDIAEENPEVVRRISSEKNINETYGRVKDEIYGIVERYNGTA